LLEDPIAPEGLSDDAHHSLEHWLARLPRSPAPAVVMGGQAAGLCFARSIGRRGVPTVMLAGSDTHTRFATTVLLPDAVARPDVWLGVLDRIAARASEPPVLLPTSDPLVLLVAQSERALESRFRFIVPPAETVEAIVNKRVQYERARQADVPIPSTHFPESAEELDTLAREISYPCLLKPYESHTSKRRIGAKAVIAGSADDLVAGYARFAGGEHRLMVQDLIPGGETALFGYVAFWDSGGEEHVWLTRQKLRQYPVRIGNGSLQRSVDLPELADLSRRLLSKFPYRGSVAIEYKLDPRDRSYRLIEINARTGASVQLSVDAGVDLPWLSYSHALRPDRSGDSPPTFRRGVQWMYEELDFRLFLEQREAGQVSWRRWLSSLRGTSSWAIWSPSDPLPFLHRAFAFVRSALGRFGAHRMAGAAAPPKSARTRRASRRSRFVGGRCTSRLTRPRRP
jgi:D-aspartate ligase